MKAIDVLAPGLFTTVQDLGRRGFGPMGVSPSGAADAISLRLGNLLVGNPQGAAALEMTLIGGTFLFEAAATVALAGSDFGAHLDGEPIETWRSIEVRAGQTIRLGPTRGGARCYLCVGGGIDVETFLGSASTHAPTGLGGLDGRALKNGDGLSIGRASSFRSLRVDPAALEKLSRRTILRVTTGPQSDWFSESSLRLFCASAYRVSEQSSRQGLRLEGAPVPPADDRQMITEGVSLGAIQVPANGQPIILFVDQQTTGGYPKIANVISADIHRLGQLRPRDEIRFEQTEVETAVSLLRKQENLLASGTSVLE